MKTHCFKLYRSKRNKKLHKLINIAGYIYNHCIALHKRYYRLFGKSLNVYALQKHLTKLKKLEKYSHWKLLGSQAIQDITQRIDKGYKLFFRNQKHNIRSAPPSFKKVKKYKSFTLKQAGYKITGKNRVSISGQKYKFHKSREIEGTIKTVTIKRDALGDLYIYFVCEQEENKVIPRAGEIVGYDFGLKTFLKSSDGIDEESPLFFKQNANRIQKANRKLSHKKKGSNNRKKARQRLSTAHRKLRHVRQDFLHKTSTRLAKNHSYIVMEDLKVSNMMRSAKGTVDKPGRNVKAKSGLNRSIAKQAWSTFRNLLTYKLNNLNGELS